jgi:hypothetical protein
MSNSFYEETMLKEEYSLVARLQQEAEFSEYVSVSYEDRITGEVQSVANHPRGPRYPEKYIVDYRMPVYVSPGQLRRDWHGTATIRLSEPVLTNKREHQGPLVTFHSNFEPFNNHMRRDWICSGNAWDVAKDNGIWHFIISMGAVINQDGFISLDHPEANEAAYHYWVARGRKPVTDIKWPLDLLSRPVPDVPPGAIQPPPIKIIAKTPGQEAAAINIAKAPDRIDIKPKSAPAPIVFTPKKG